MKLSKQEMREEAVRILKEMGVSSNIIDNYITKGDVPVFWLGLCNCQKGKWKSVSFNIRNGVEKSFNYDEITKLYKGTGEVYAITIDCVTGMHTINFLYISPYSEDLEYMCNRSNDGTYRVYAYCYNVLEPNWGESGAIFVTQSNGFIKRIA